MNKPYISTRLMMLLAILSSSGQTYSTAVNPHSQDKSAPHQDKPISLNETYAEEAHKQLMAERDQRMAKQKMDREDQAMQAKARAQQQAEKRDLKTQQREQAEKLARLEDLQSNNPQKQQNRQEQDVMALRKTKRLEALKTLAEREDLTTEDKAKAKEQILTNPAFIPVGAPSSQERQELEKMWRKERMEINKQRQAQS